MNKKLEVEIVQVLSEFSKGDYSKRLPDSTNSISFMINYLGETLENRQKVTENHVLKIIALQDELISLRKSIDFPV